MGKPITKGSHFLPRTYLKHFLLENKLLMYKKGKIFFKSNLDSRQRIIEISGEKGLNRIGKENNLYRIELREGIAPNLFEDLFQEIAENNFDNLVEKIKKKGIDERIEDKLKEKISIFIAVMRLRTPLFKWEIEEATAQFVKNTTKWNARMINEEEKERLKVDYEKETGKMITDKEFKETIEDMAQGEFDGTKIEFSNNLFLKAIALSLEKHSYIFFNMKMGILKAKEGRYFVTSDNPVVYFVPKEKVNFYNNYKSLASPFTEVFFSLTKDYGIYLCRKDGYREIVMSADRKMIDIFNENIAINSKDFIFSPLKMNFLNKFIEEYIPYPFKITTT